MFKLSQFEKIFWLTIVLFLILYITLSIVAFQNHANAPHEANQTVMGEIFQSDYQKIVQYTTVVEEVEDTTIQKALEENATQASIAYNLQYNIDELDKKIDKHINHAFGVVYAHVDTFLDFHYSVVGEYSELGAMATGEIENYIQKQLFPPQFQRRIARINPLIAQEFTRHTQKHLGFINQTLTQNIDRGVNLALLQRIQSDIQSNITTQQNKITAVVSVGVASTVAKVVASKIAIKAYSKAAIKSSSKLATKGVTTGAAAATGALCGPAVVICAPVLASVAWFGSDAIIVQADEYMHRNALKKEIIASIEHQKEVLKRDYKRIYGRSLHKLSRQIQEAYAKERFKKRIQRKIIDRL